MQEQQTFQSKGQLFALQVHAVWEKFENVVLYPFRKAAEYLGQTHVFQERIRNDAQLRLVK
jgi:hypothetical protein